ncbi:hypothetical protein DES53_11085 [Roseimicrobium gellanilyticum]|uniref:4-O-methyl-glucuronoyl methylesterase-like domain-containing protein n=1 Tax=Roseimicrobium gellanilyticum TaxID=748857 RepID=A0A366H9U0_9BACT|nr:acetylxylan esterase [Roseimicrobium gellanilyticum]RBP39061.1 hypothetical protein DES53_11085 [Roseimicrobium gellanilyticum]
MHASSRLSAALLAGSLAMASTSFTAHAQERPGINYDEAKAGGIPNLDPLTASDGTKITTKEQWLEKRKPELMKLFASEVYGKTPEGQGVETKAQLVGQDTAAFGGKAIMRQVKLTFSSSRNGRKAIADLLIYIPKGLTKPAPAFVQLNFGGNHYTTSDPSIPISDAWFRNDKDGNYVNNKATEKSRNSGERRWPYKEIIERGYAVCTAYYGDFDPDFDDGFQNGVQPLFYKDGQTKPAADEWGSIGAWAWGMSRMADYLQGVPEVDGKKLISVGHSRLGKTSLWAGAQDERFGIVVSNDSGAGGAALSKRIFGETVAVLNKSFPHWFCDNFNKYSDNEKDLPVDQHELIALMTPRPVYIASATEDNWADQKGEFLGGKLAEPVYALFSLKGLGVDEPPAPDKSVGDAIGYHNRTGKHDILLYDWEQYMNFADKHWGKPQ